MGSGPAWGAWVRAEGSYAFGPETAEAEACRLAEDRALSRAVTDTLGETLGADDLTVCDQMAGDVQCRQHQAVWTMLGGGVRGVRGRSVRVEPYVEDTRRCLVSLEADVSPPDAAPDPSFTLGLAVNAASFRDGDAMVLTLSPSQPMSIQIFQWLPYRRDGFQVVKVFPNAYDRSAQVDGPATIPGPAGRYSLTVRFPEGQDRGVRLVDEFLMVVATRRSVPLADGYGIEDFNRAVAEVPVRDRRILRRAYTVVRSAP